MIASTEGHCTREAESLQEHSVKVVARQAAVVSKRTWQHAFGVMMIETCADGSVWIDGKPVPETLPAHRPESKLPMASTAV